MTPLGQQSKPKWHPDSGAVGFALIASIAMLGYVGLTMWAAETITPLVWVGFYWTGSIGGLVVFTLWALILEDYLIHRRIAAQSRQPKPRGLPRAGRRAGR